MTASASLPMPARREAAAPDRQGKVPAKGSGKATAPTRSAKGLAAARPAGAWCRRNPAVAQSLVFALLVARILFYGWQDSDEGHLSPESGLGYGLGIAGASAMLLVIQVVAGHLY
jgi:hypothetical protein